ncbi:hypothetical protein FGO68_gene4961 [Halteria grandinella]|uniref:Uncharacterized protein n=1 Tax=Halteria grandinella TaxID=5974 RepID=A0A8J8T377_HALGN|nr:hypothetical protein FGO68_gene4961 [Halteria grandinella]
MNQPIEQYTPHSSYLSSPSLMNTLVNELIGSQYNRCCAGTCLLSFLIFLLRFLIRSTSYMRSYCPLLLFRSNRSCSCCSYAFMRRVCSSSLSFFAKLEYEGQVSLGLRSYVLPFASLNMPWQCSTSNTFSLPSPSTSASCLNLAISTFLKLLSLSLCEQSQSTGGQGEGSAQFHLTRNSQSTWSLFAYVISSTVSSKRSYLSFFL